MRNVSKKDVRKLVGKSIYAVRRDGSVVTGKLVRISRNKLVLAPLKKDKGKVVKTNAILPLVLFDLLAIGTFWGGGFGCCGGFGGGFGGGFCGCGCGAPIGKCFKGGYGGYGGGYGGYGGGYGDFY
ncbi:hypothetical protein KP806_20620 [Paenibacillus sp. N4]|uniref:hypothetical protein n=1 Tax=Paenibacillus vietnamensis TaxID=2590547 RepID=UPI001CD18D87|nr:hypothetical protein [Paenibacillus vietnamensis]MCA0757467.1 hypothetical protein [Paenibacillus vietnamensis]